MRKMKISVPWPSSTEFRSKGGIFNRLWNYSSTGFSLTCLSPKNNLAKFKGGGRGEVGETEKIQRQDNRKEEGGSSNRLFGLISVRPFLPLSFHFFNSCKTSLFPNSLEFFSGARSLLIRNLLFSQILKVHTHLFTYATLNLAPSYTHPLLPFSSRTIIGANEERRWWVSKKC